MAMKTQHTENLWYIAKAVLRGKLIAIQSYLKKQEKHQIDNLEEMRVLEKFNLPLNQEEIEVMNNSIEIIEIEAVIKNFP